MILRALVVCFHEDWVGYGRSLKKDHLLQAWPKTFEEDGNTFMLSNLLPLVSKTHLSTFKFSLHCRCWNVTDSVLKKLQILLNSLFSFYLDTFLTSVIPINNGFFSVNLSDLIEVLRWHIYLLNFKYANSNAAQMEFW